MKSAGRAPGRRVTWDVLNKRDEYRYTVNINKMNHWKTKGKSDNLKERNLKIWKSERNSLAILWSLVLVIKALQTPFSWMDSAMVLIRPPNFGSFSLFWVHLDEWSQSRFVHAILCNWFGSTRITAFIKAMQIVKILRFCWRYSRKIVSSILKLLCKVSPNIEKCLKSGKYEHRSALITDSTWQRMISPKWG